LLTSVTHLGVDDDGFVVHGRHKRAAGPLSQRQPCVESLDSDEHSDQILDNHRTYETGFIVSDYAWLAQALFTKMRKQKAMTQMLGISCHDMITKHEDDAYQIPQKFFEIAKTPKIMSLTMKEDQIVDRTVAVNSVDANDGSHIVAPSTKDTATTTSSAPVTPAKRQWRADKGTVTTQHRLHFWNNSDTDLRDTTWLHM
ncbi:hypothetical protein M8C21_010640, partial [Ambrosia artemisiifolia]